MQQLNTNINYFSSTQYEVQISRTNGVLVSGSCQHEESGRLYVRIRTADIKSI